MNELSAKPVVKRRLLANTQQIVESVLLPQDTICGSKRFVLFKGKAAWIERVGVWRMFPLLLFSLRVIFH